METAEALTPNAPTPIQFELEATGWRFCKGHRVRLSINGSDFPNIWPTPYRGIGAVHRGPGLQAELRLPIWSHPSPPPFEFLPSPNPPASTGSGSDPAAWRVVHDVLEDRLHFVIRGNNEFTVSNRDPATAYTRGQSVAQASWEGFTARSEANCVLYSDAKAFHITITLNVYVNDALHFQRQWSQSTPRVLM
jgi:hypothetical protein